MKYLILYTLVFCYVAFIAVGPAEAQSNEKSLDHPRGVIVKEDIPEMRKRILRETYQTAFKRLMHTGRYFDTIPSPRMSVYEVGSAARIMSYLYILRGNESYASKAYQRVKYLADSTEIYNDPYSKGLTRASLLKSIAISYDLCYDAWSEDKRKKANRAIAKGVRSLSSNMGYSANYALVSNWMGVRYSTVIFASLIYDYTRPEGRSPLLPYLWNALKRLRDHLGVNLNENGWNVESMGYHGYNWSFIAPAITALQNHTESHAFELKNYAPDALNSLWGYSTSLLNIKAFKSKGLKPDLSDDNMMASDELYFWGMRLYPKSQLPALKWMKNYMRSSEIYIDRDGDDFYSIAYAHPDMEPLNPSVLGWQQYVDEEQGVVLFRNRFQNKNDIVAAFTTTSRRVQGHSGFDNLTFRILGLDNLWAIGAGRTGKVAGQTNLFPLKNADKKKNRGKAGTLEEYEFFSHGSGYAIGQGSCLGVNDHRRYFAAHYDEKSRAEALFVVVDSSRNGARWRLNTPAFNKIRFKEDGFVIEGPNGASLRARVFGQPQTLELDTGRVRYGGPSGKYNPGINYHGKKYQFNKWIDVYCNGNIGVAITLQKKGETHPGVKWIPQYQTLMVDETSYSIR